MRISRCSAVREQDEAAHHDRGGADPGGRPQLATSIFGGRPLEQSIGVSAVMPPREQAGDHRAIEHERLFYRLDRG